jgi:hypothetical protein
LWQIKGVQRFRMSGLEGRKPKLVKPQSKKSHLEQFAVKVAAAIYDLAQANQRGNRQSGQRRQG